MDIKFRGQKLGTKEWIFGSLISDLSKGYAIVQQTHNPIQNGVIQGWCFGIKPETVGQFTGFVDDNGNEIYSGDRFNSPIEDIKYYEVYFENGCFKMGYTLNDKFFSCGKIDQCVELLKEYELFKKIDTLSLE